MKLFQQQLRSALDQHKEAANNYEDDEDDVFEKQTISNKNLMGLLG